MQGIFVSFEGGEGCGKSTQIALLAEALTAAGREVVVVREPGGTAAGEEIRHLLKHHPAGAALTPEAELLLFAASRAQLVREVIAPAIAAGKVVIADRFLDSTTVYQGDARGLPAGAVAAINRFAAGPHRPDVTFLLDLDPATGLARARTRNADAADHIDQLPAEFHERVRAGYLRLAAAEPRIVVLDASQSPDHVHAGVVRSLNTRFHGLLP